MLVELTIDLSCLGAEESRAFSKTIDIPIMPEVFDTESHAVQLKVSDSEIRYDMTKRVYSLFWDEIVDSFLDWSPVEHMEWKCRQLLENDWAEL